MPPRRPSPRPGNPPPRRGPNPGGPASRRPPQRRGPGPQTQGGPGRRGEGENDQPGLERLQKVLAHAGVSSRRACEELILQGRVTVDGQTVKELGTRVDPKRQQVAVDGQKVHSERNVYYAVHKPKGYVSTNSDPAGKPLVISLLPEIPQRAYAVGRLDEQSTGLMLLTNDGELANKLAHPRFGVEKVYRVVVAGEPGREILDQLTQGIWLAEGKVRAKRVKVIGHKGQATVLEMVLGEGKNREIRRMLAKLGHKVMSLTRIAVGPIGLKGLGVGECRPLTGAEVELLHKVAAGMVLPAPRYPDRRDRTPRPQGSPRPGRPASPNLDGQNADARGGVGPGRPPRPRPSQAPATGRPEGQGPRPNQGPNRPQRPPYQPGPRSSQGPGTGPGRPPRPPQSQGQYQNQNQGPRPPQGSGPGRPSRPPQGQGQYQNQNQGSRPPQGSGPGRPPRPPLHQRPNQNQNQNQSQNRPRSPEPLGEERPTRRIIGLDPVPPSRRPGPPGLRIHRPGPKRPPRAAQGLKRPPKRVDGDSADE